jgi:endonuclease/exonuclease/phosphatase family metal-dependent hydrolase
MELAAGRALIHVKLEVDEGRAGDQRAESIDGWTLGRIDSSIRSLYRKALLSAVADYEVWIVAEGEDGFALLPGNTPPLAGPQPSLDAGMLAAALPRALGLRAFVPSAHRLESKPRNTLKVMTYNIHSCVGLDGKLAPSRIARIIRGFDPDIVALQEVDVKRNRSKGEDQAARLARELGMHVAFCCTADRAWERYGHALLTRWPATVIASGIFSGEGQLSEPRGALLARVEIAGRAIYVANTHFGLTGRDRLRQAEILLGSEWLAGTPAEAPLIVCGDFNMSPGSQPYRLMGQRFKDAQTTARVREGYETFPSPIPFTRLDFIFVSRDLEVERIAVVKNSQTRVASDHLPVVAELVMLDR